jgi:hypothetical protein
MSVDVSIEGITLSFDSSDIGADYHVISDELYQASRGSDYHINDISDGYYGDKITVEFSAGYYTRPSELESWLVETLEAIEAKYRKVTFTLEEPESFGFTLSFENADYNVVNEIRDTIRNHYSTEVFVVTVDNDGSGLVVNVGARNRHGVPVNWLEAQNSLNDTVTVIIDEL